MNYDKIAKVLKSGLIYFAISLVIFSGSAFGQDYLPDVELGPKIKKDEGISFSNFIGANSTNFFAVKDYYRNPCTEFNTSLKKVQTITPIYKENQKHFQFAVVMNSKIHFFTSAEDDLGQQEVLQVKTHQNDNSWYKSSPVSLFQVNRSSYKKKVRIKYDYAVSKDKTFLLVTVNIISRSKKDQRQTIHYYVVSDNLNIEHHNSYTRSTATGVLLLEESIISNSGEVAISAVNTAGEKYLLTDSDNGKIQELKIKLANRCYPLAVSLNHDRNGKVEISGTYSKSGILTGGFIMNYSENEFSEAININILDSVSVRGKSSMNEYYNHDYKLSKTLWADDGVYQIYENIHDNYYESSSTVTYYSRSGLYIIKFNRAGELLWSNRVSKSQRSSYYENVSFEAFLMHNKLRILYSDVLSNIKITEIDKQGEKSSYGLFDNNSFGVVLQPRNSIQISESEIIILGTNLNYVRLARILFD